MRRLEQIYTGRNAETYDSSRVHSPLWQREQQIIGGMLRRRLAPGDRVLDIAAGTGRWLEIYAERRARPTLLDVSDDMLRIAAGKAADLGMDVVLQQADLLNDSELPAGDWAVATRFFNWIDLSGISRNLQAAFDAGVSGFIFSIVLLNGNAPVTARLWARGRVQLKNLNVRTGRGNKARYHLHTDANLERLLDGLGVEIIDEQVITRRRGEFYKAITVLQKAARHQPSTK